MLYFQEQAYSEDQFSSGENNEDSSEGCSVNGSSNLTENKDQQIGQEESPVVKTHISPGRVVRRKKGSQAHHSHRSSFPQARPPVSQSKQAQNLQNSFINASLIYEDEGLDSSTDRLDGLIKTSIFLYIFFIGMVLDDLENFGSKPDLTKFSDIPVPEWVVLGESVLIRPYNSSGVVAYIGDTEFAFGTWIGVELDAPKGNSVA